MAKTKQSSKDQSHKTRVVFHFNPACYFEIAMVNTHSTHPLLCSLNLTKLPLHVQLKLFCLVQIPVNHSCINHHGFISIISRNNCGHLNNLDNTDHINYFKFLSRIIWGDCCYIKLHKANSGVLTKPQRAFTQWLIWESPALVT